MLPHLIFHVAWWLFVTTAAISLFEIYRYR